MPATYEDMNAPLIDTFRTNAGRECRSRTG